MTGKIHSVGKCTEIDQHHPRFTHDCLLDIFLLFACLNFHTQLCFWRNSGSRDEACVLRGAWESSSLTVPCQQRQPGTRRGRRGGWPQHFEKARLSIRVGSSHDTRVQLARECALPGAVKYVFPNQCRYNLYGLK